MIRRAIYNLGILVLVALPVWVALVWLQSLVWPAEWMRGSAGWGQPGDAVGMFAVQYLAMAVPVAFGGVLHQLLATNFPADWPSRTWKGAMVLTSPLVALPLVLMTPDAGTLLDARVIVPTLAALVVYGVLARPLRIAPSYTDGPGREASS